MCGFANPNPSIWCNRRYGCEGVASPHFLSLIIIPILPSCGLLPSMSMQGQFYKSHFDRRETNILEVNILLVVACVKFVDLSKQCLIRQFIGLWPSPYSTNHWIHKNRKAMVQGNLTHYLCGHDFLFFYKKNKIGF